MQYAGIIVDITNEKLDKVFTYHIPEHLRQVLRVGMEVRIPFGRESRMVSGYVVSLSDTCDIPEKRVKDIESVVKEHTAIEGYLVELASWMASYYGSTMIQALKTVLPAKEKVRAVYKRSVRLSVSEEEAEKALSEMKRKHQNARARLLSELILEKEIPNEILTKKLHVTRAVLSALTEQKLVSVEEKREYRDPVGFGAENVLEKRRHLMPEQETAVRTICEDLKQDIHKTYLLYGVTGSGKTEVYLQVIEQVVQSGGQAIVLIPEIALTYQTVMRFRRRFGSRVSIIHSKLSKGERYDQFLRAKEGKLDVVIGPRSALFMPLANLKLIVIDEEHETSYKSEITPRYHARETAIQRAKNEGASVLLGSATPSLEAYTRALSGEYTLLTLTERVENRPLAHVEIVDLREEMRAGNRSIISRRLDEKIREHLGRKEQVMLFLNRRGYSGCYACRECGHVMKCPHCDVSLTHHKNGKLICHYCGYETKIPQTCPSCGSEYIGGFRIGTEAVEQLLEKLYPDARILRMDMDTTRKKEGHTKILSAFGNREADILLGTQMIVKGHDFPDVTLVGVLAADLSLHTGDFRSAERTFALLAQAAGRAGRGTVPGEVIIQTYDPEHYAVQTAAKQDYDAFYQEEMGYREMMSYPPAAHLFSIMLSGPDEAYLNKAADYLKQFGDKLCERYGVKSFGPGTPGIGKLKDIYRKVLYYKHENYAILITLKDYLVSYMEINSGFSPLGIQIDFEG